MNIYYRGYDPASPITTGTEHILAFCSRLILSMLRSVKYMDDAAFDSFVKTIAIDNIWVCVLLIAVSIIAAVIGGPVAAVAKLVLGYIGANELLNKIIEIYEQYKDWIMVAYNANNEDDLDKAAKSFAAGTANGVIAALEFMLIHKIFRLAQFKVAKKYAEPAWLRTTWERTVGERMKRRQGGGGAQKPKPGGPEDESAAKQALNVIGTVLPAQGIKATAQAVGKFPVGAAVGVGVGVAFLTTIGVAVAVSGKKRKRK